MAIEGDLSPERKARVARTFKHLRERIGLSQDAVAQFLGVDIKTVQRIEGGKLKFLPTAKTLDAAADLFGATLDEVAGRRDVDDTPKSWTIRTRELADQELSRPLNRVRRRPSKLDETGWTEKNDYFTPSTSPADDPNRGSAIVAMHHEAIAELRVRLQQFPGPDKLQQAVRAVENSDLAIVTANEALQASGGALQLLIRFLDFVPLEEPVREDFVQEISALLRASARSR